MPKSIWREDRVRIRIAEIYRTTDRGIWARLEKTGKLAWLPRAFTEMLPGAAIVPVWLARKVLGRAEESVPCM